MIISVTVPSFLPRVLFLSDDYVLNAVYISIGIVNLLFLQKVREESL